MNNFFQLIEYINNISLFSILENFNIYYSLLIIFIIYLLYYLISNSFIIIILLFIGIIIGFYIVYILRDTILPLLARM
jgi:hypothetical protein